QQVDALQGRPVILQLLFLFELGDAFHSWWFGALVLLLALNLTACSIQRLPPIWIAIRSTPKRLSDAALRTATYKHVYHTSLPVKKIEKIIQYIFPRAQRDLQGDVACWFVHKHRFARLGVYVIHTALLVILFSSVLHTSCGVNGMLLLAPGRSARVLQARGPAGVLYGHDLGFWVRCNRFHLGTFADGSPREFASELVVWGVNQSAEQGIRKTIRVGDPLHYGGYTLYQASYQRLPNADRVRLSVVYKGALSKTSDAVQHATDTVEYKGVVGHPLRLRDGSALIPLEVVDDTQGFGQALRLRHVQKEGHSHQKNHFTVFRDYPDFDKRMRASDWHVVFHEAQPQYATGISVSKTSLVPAVFAGFILLFVGLCIAFGMRDRRFYVRVKSLGDGVCEVALAGFVHRRKTGQFPQEFDAISKRLQGMLCP
ncbi:MAG: cytochrome c biogenesis protein ResB, partial [Myxococcota bacterium]